MNANRYKNREFWHEILISILTCAVIGIVGGFFGSLFHYLLDSATHIRIFSPWLIYFLPVGGLLIALLFKKGNIDEYFNTEKVYHNAKKSEKISFWLAPVIYFSSFLTHLFGGSAGREGAAIAIGGSIGSDFSRIFKRPSEKTYLFIIAGMGATFSGVLATPFTAIIFAVEVTILYRKKGLKTNTLAILCASISSLFGFLMALLLKVEPLSFGNFHFETINIRIAFISLLLVLLSMTLAIVFKITINFFRHFYNKINNPFFRIFSGGVFVVCLTILIGSQRYSGAGSELIFESFSENAKVYDFILKLILTVFTMGCGYCGGEMIPAMVIGATFGFTMSTFLPISIEIAVCVSLISVFATYMRSPVASLVLGFEVFGFSGWLYYLIMFVPTLAYTILVSNKKHLNK